MKKPNTYSFVEKLINIARSTESQKERSEYLDYITGMLRSFTSLFNLKNHRFMEWDKEEKEMLVNDLNQYLVDPRNYALRDFDFYVFRAVGDIFTYCDKNAVLDSAARTIFLLNANRKYISPAAWKRIKLKHSIVAKVLGKEAKNKSSLAAMMSNTELPCFREFSEIAQKRGYFIPLLRVGLFDERSQIENYYN